MFKPPPSEWSEWCDGDDPSGQYDYESLREAVKKCPSVCRNPSAAECRVVGSKTPFDQTSDKFREACTAYGGLVCKNADQADGKCEDYEIRFRCPPDVDECLENTHNCDENARCQNTHGGFNCICNDGYLGDGRKCFMAARCSIWGNTYYSTFDGENYGVEGECNYKLVEPCDSFENSPDFNIVLKNYRYRGSTRTLKYLEITIYGYTIKMAKSLAKVNGRKICPPYKAFPADRNRPGSFIIIKATTSGLVLYTDFGLSVRTSRCSQFQIVVPSDVRNGTCGMCGDYDGQMNGFLLPDGSYVETPVPSAWLAEDNSENCSVDDEPECSVESMAAATTACAILRDASKFESCLARIGDRLEEYVTSCVKDVCRMPSAICESVQAFASACENFGISVQWRSEEFCPLECGPNMHFESDGPMCPETCYEVAPSCSEQVTTVEGCQCNEGFVKSGTECVARDQCGCSFGDKYYQINDKFFDTDCTQLCQCMPDGQVVCDNTVTCHVNGQCMTNPDGTSECQCKDGYEGSGLDCTDEDECSKDHKCNENAKCINEEGSYSCRCDAGYTGDGFECEDANECEDGVDRCSRFAACVNEIGSYACVCKDGYESFDKGRVCVERVPEVPARPEECTVYQREQCMECADCKPLNNVNFECICPMGTIGDGMKGEGHTGCTKSNCPEGWIRLDDNCYEVITQPETFEDAEDQCEAQGGNLASVLNQQTIQHLQEELQILGLEELVWIGYSDKDLEGFFRWTDNTGSDYANWASGEPAQDGNRQKDCVALGKVSEYKFVTKVCDIKLGYICSRPVELKLCPRGWTHFDGSCYLSSGDLQTWNEAVLRCNARGADLTVISSHIENEILRESVIPAQSGADLWIGGELINGSISWVFEGSELTLWANASNNALTCIAANSQMKWKTSNCDALLGYICEKKMNEERGCLPGTVQIGEDCVVLTTDCEEIGGMTAGIGYAPADFNLPITRFIESLLTPVDVYLGKYKTISTYSGPFNWAAYEPNVTLSDDVCVYIKSSEDYKWGADNCEQPLETLCLIRSESCSTSGDCAEDNSMCSMGQCRCNPGYRRAADRSCEDIPECTEGNPCGEQICLEQVGGYECVCDSSYEKYGEICIPKSRCEINEQCNTRATCVDGNCQCNPGYEGDGTTICDNINECEDDLYECDENSECNDLDGSYECPCKTGFVRDPSSGSCQRLPRDCDEVYQRQVVSGEAVSGSYLIDPDQEGGCEPFTVSCVMRDGFGVTVIPSNSQAPREIRSSEAIRRPVTYTKTLEQINCLIKASEFCYQNVLYKCSGGAMLQGVSSLTYNGTDNVIDQCACGMIGSCSNPRSKCNCDGSPMGEQKDSYKFIDKNILPITSFNVGGVRGGQKASSSVGPLLCSQRPFDLPKNCEDARANYGLSESGELLIDVDGVQGNLQPFLVYCELKPLVAVTVVKPTRPVEKPSTPGEVPVEYNAPEEAIKILVSDSNFCSQEMAYRCKDSSLKGSSYKTADGTTRNAFVGGVEGKGMCACGLTNSCEQDNVQCNCDIQDGRKRFDFGTIINKEDLPVRSVSVFDIDSNSSGKLQVGDLRCTSQQIDIPPTCQDYREMGFKQSYTYLIDPDGPNGNEAGNVAPFPVSCIMDKKRPIGITVVGHNNEEPTPVDDSEAPGSYTKDITYNQASPEQLEALTQVSSYCTQEMAVSCVEATLQNADDPSNPNAFWRDSNGNVRQYYAGDGSSGARCQCGLDGNCARNMACNCDANLNKTKRDAGVLTNKDDLPVRQVNFGDTGDSATDRIDYQVGKLFCYAIYKTCYDRYQNAPLPRDDLVDGPYVIDPDGVLNEDPFMVHCNFPYKTIVKLDEANYHKLEDSPENVGPAAQVVRPVYIDATVPQLKALTEVADFCRQYMRYSCQHAPLSSNVYWASSDATKQPGWSGNAGGDKCACGEVGKCDGGGSCNCDVDDNVERQDDGWLINKDILPVVEIGFGLSTANISSGEKKMAEYHLGSLECSNELKQFGIYRDCQDLRNHLTPNNEVRSNAELIDPDLAEGPLQPFVVYCEMYDDPPIGITVIPSDLPEPVKIPKDQALDIPVTYTSGTPEQLTTLTNLGFVCSQEMAYRCQQGAVLNLANGSGLYNNAGESLPYWDGVNGGMGCSGGQCNCDGSQAGQDKGVIRETTQLPITNVKLQATGAAAELVVGELRCYGLYPDCESIRKYGANLDPNWNGRYAIDSDGQGPLPPYAVQCDFLTYPNQGITVIEIDGPTEFPVSDTPLSEPITYENNVTPEQAHSLAQISGFCLQGVKYTCLQAPLMANGGGFLNFDGSKSTKFAGADNSDVEGCACVVLGTCPENQSCRCDAAGPMVAEEGDFVTNRDILPVTGVVSDGVSQEGGDASFSVGNLRCGPKPFGLPKDCQEALEFGYSEGEFLIYPSSSVDPFLVYCDFTSFPGIGVTIVPTDVEDVKVNFPSEEPVVYKGAEPDQIDALAKESERCYLPMKFECEGTMFSDAFSAQTSNAKDVVFFGSARQNRMCSCGEQGRCGGDDGRLRMKERNCNCDVLDGKKRVDAGVYGNQGEKPLVSVKFGPQAEGASGVLTLGNLYCVDKPIDLDECSIGFNDCHENAECVNRNNYYECVCREGYRGKGRPGLWANGRECYDDDECALGLCPRNSLCENNEGSYVCTCPDGYQMNEDETECVDVNECSLPNQPCYNVDSCTNEEPGYSCSCQDGYVGDGVNCTAITLESCQCLNGYCKPFNSPVEYIVQDCSYTLAKTSCSGQANSYEVIVNYANDKQLDSVLIVSQSRTLRLENSQASLDGVLLSLPYNTELFRVSRLGDLLVVSAESLPYWRVEYGGADNSIAVQYADLPGFADSCGICGTLESLVYGDHCKDALPAGTDVPLPLSNGIECSCTDIGAPPPPVCSLIEEYTQYSPCRSAMEFADRLDLFTESCGFKDVCSAIKDIFMDCRNSDTPSSVAEITAYYEMLEGNGCELPCDENDVSKYFSFCGPACPESCDGSCLHEAAGCVSGCYCNAGLFQDNDKCSPKSACGCVMNGQYFPRGSSVVNEDCSEVCECKPGSDEMTCRPLSCTTGTECSLQNGVRDCHCSEGYALVNGTCQDINECNNEDVCPENSQCGNTQGSYECTCDNGYMKENDGSCKDIDECLNENTCDENAECSNSLGSYECVCHEGYSMVDGVCQDVEECELLRDACERSTTECSNTQGSYTCDCLDGYERLTETSCKDIDECTSPDACDSNSTCANAEGSYDCVCNNGFRKDGDKCVDIPECTELSDPCPSDSECKEQIGSYTCVCKTGLRMNPAGDLCEDINECIEDQPCPANNSKCANSIGSYSCGCEDGYQGDGVESCDNIDECTTLLQPCGANSICIDQPGSFNCECMEGYASLSATFTNCQDVDECANGSDNCDDYAACDNVPGSFTCQCILGFFGNGTSCTDIDECGDDLDNCGPKENCANTHGSFVCVCQDAYTRVGDVCVPIDECDDSPCDENAKCTELDEGYECNCKTGYEGSGEPGDCQNINECNTTCNGLAQICEDSEGSYSCTCDDGFMQMPDNSCADILECSDPELNDCDPNAECIEEVGSYSCECDPGFSGSGRSCKDIDECETTCNGLGQICNNLPGTFSCVCDAGFMQQANKSCQDIDECETVECASDKASCNNTIGGYECVCLEGFSEGNSTSCEDVDECLDNPCTGGQLCENTAGGYSCQCEKGYSLVDGTCTDDDECETATCIANSHCVNSPGSFECQCNDGFEDRDGVCADIDECENREEIDCDVNGRCQNIAGSYSCDSCVNGYRGNGQVCEDVDECVEDIDNCSDQGTCANTEGSFTCSCNDGYSGDGVDCDDIDECYEELDNCVENSRCENQAPGYTCKCTSGYEMVDGVCKDIDDCASSPCLNGGTCVDGLNNFDCLCQDGYTIHSNGVECLGPDDCTYDPTICESRENQVCRSDPENSQRRSCQCKMGYYYDEVEQICKDEDECKRFVRCPLHQRCRNIVGSYVCECIDGYEMKEELKYCTEIDECELNLCPANSKCVDGLNVHTCECDVGYTMIYTATGEEFCQKDDECQTDTDCPPNHLCESDNEGVLKCKCKEGFDENCNDINECLGPNECHKDAICTNTIGSYDCKCLKGYSGGGIICKDIDECKTNNNSCGSNTECVNTPGGHLCKCLQGYSGHCDACRDINECANGLAKCSRYATCINSPGSYICKCNTGYVLENGVCKNIDECELGVDRCPPNSACIDLRGTYACTCLPGFQKNTEDLCENINECNSADSASLCPANATCYDSEGSYKCECDPGFIGNEETCLPDVSSNVCGSYICHETASCIANSQCECPSGYTGEPLVDGSGCIDVNECLTGDSCDPNAECENFMGSYKCKCYPGYSGNGRQCDEIIIVGCTTNADCGLNSECKDNGVCVCNSGFAGENGVRCKDINECEVDNEVCGEGSDCYNNYGSYECVCKLGYSNPDMSSGKLVCTNVDECELGIDTCVAGTCVDTPGSYRCVCSLPNYFNGFVCVAPDEGQCSPACNEREYCDEYSQCQCQEAYDTPEGCQADVQCPNCHTEATCTVNQQLGASCTCNPGFEGNGIFCQDINECISGEVECGDYSYCVNTVGSAYCACYPSYQQVDGVCKPLVTDTDPCACGSNGACDDPELFTCSCDEGYEFRSELLSNRCQDIDECNKGGYCHAYANCVNSVGSYSCSCQPGYLGDGKELCELDRCNPNPCGAARCESLGGSLYHCVCPDGYTLVGKECIITVTDCSLLGGCKENSHCVVEEGVTARCECNTGYRGNGVDCVDINECLQGRQSHNCAEHASCFNFVGGHTCSCNDGFTGDGHYCKQVNECDLDLDNCSPNAICNDLIGSFTCTCKDGYEGNGEICALKPGCSVTNDCHTDALCQLTDQGYQCTCNQGFTGDGYNCEKILECEDPQLNQCFAQFNVRCENRLLGHECVCLPGFKPISGSSNACEEINECLETDVDCGNNSKCVDKINDYQCQCLGGYWSEDRSGRDCKDIDECAWDNDCSNLANCINTEGGYTCSCKDGYTGNGLSCSEIDECLLNPNACPANSQCIDGLAQFSCQCDDGFTTSDVNTCVDIDECSLNQDNCHADANCTNSIGSFTCTCNPGFRGNGVECTAYDPCDEYGACHQLATCENLNGIAKCTCFPGYEGDGKNTCDIVDECALNEDNCLDDLANCINENPGFRCECKDGYYGDGVNSCEDIDECDPSSENGGGHSCDADSSRCNNTDGGYACPCNYGYEQVTPKTCKRIDLCDTPANNCDENANCEDVNRQVVCTCKTGYKKLNGICQNINECVECGVGMSECNPCLGNSQCEDNEGSYSCLCLPGYTYNGAQCTDDDECSLGKDNCPDTARCANSPGTFTCVCPTGYNYDADTNTCQDIDECLKSPCEYCSNNPGSFSCSCPDGYYLDGLRCIKQADCDARCGENEECSLESGSISCSCKPGYKRFTIPGACEDINECESNPCGDGAECNNLPGSFECTCSDGYRGNYPSCEDINECLEMYPCDDNEDCQNSIGSYTCKCSSGYAGSPCAPVNECLNPSACPANSDCVDLTPGYQCNCRDGFEKDENNVMCIDTNECDESPCDESRSRCENYNGGYSCNCLPGFAGQNCTDIDECSSNPCNENAKCTNEVGSYKCSCKIGYTGDGLSCFDIDDCDPNPCNDLQVCTDGINSHTCVCVPGYRMEGDICIDINECNVEECGENEYCKNNPGSFQCLCNDNYERDLAGKCKPVDPCDKKPCLGGATCIADGINYKCLCLPGYSGPDCEDIDECLAEAICSNGKCVNFNGGYNCDCNDGYRKDGQNCVDINECMEPTASLFAASCGPKQTCRNTPGSYRCLCNNGYTGDNCEDINECEQNRCSSNSVCFNSPGSFRCDCVSGFMKEGSVCKDVDECRSYPMICGPAEAGYCSNTDGDYVCNCFEGYELRNGTCQDVNECLQPGICGLNGLCGNTDGSFVCTCEDGYLFINNECQNIDECATNRCSPNADCIDEPGTFRCRCKLGYRGEGRTCTKICDTDSCPKQAKCVVVNDQAKCVCRCNGRRCSIPGKVCGTDAKTYSSESQMVIAACEQSKRISKDYDGACKMTCDDALCPNHKMCIVNPGTNRPTCVCHICTQAEITSGKICTDKNRQFGNLCAFKKWQCSRPDDDSVVAKYGLCSKQEGCQVSDFGPWSACSVSCGQGIKTKTREVIFDDSGNCPPLVQTAKCYEPDCPTDGCGVCDGVGKVCGVVNDKPTCVCPDCAGLDRVLVCGRIGRRDPDTYINRCILQKKACALGEIFTEVHPGHCGALNPSEPLNCTVVPHFGKVRDADNCVTTKTLTVNKCSGGCGTDASDCCRPSAVRYMKTQLTCPSDAVKFEEVPVITECKCGKVDKDSGVEASTSYEGFSFLYGR